MAAVSLNDRQRDVLRRIINGKRPTSDEATTVYALRSRGLVVTGSAYAYTSATATYAGRHVLAGGNPPAPPARELDIDDEQSNLPADPEGLLTKLAEYRGKLVIADPPERQRAAWRRLLHATRDYQRDSDQILRHRGRSNGDLTIWLETRTTAPAAPATPEPVPIPERVIRPHPLVAGLRHITVGYRSWIDTHRIPDVAHVRISPASKQRTIRILHALALEAQRRGYTVESTSSRNCPGGFGININGHVHELTIVEHYRRTPHVLTAREHASKARGGFDWAPRWDYEATGRLVLRHGHGTYAPPLAGDRVRWKVEDRLVHVIDQLEQLSIVAEQRRLVQVARQLREAARRELKQQAAEDAWLLRERVRRLDGQIEQWEHVTRIRRFVEAARSSGDVDELTLEWLDWANSYADSIDPITAGLGPITA